MHSNNSLFDFFDNTEKLHDRGSQKSIIRNGLNGTIIPVISKQKAQVVKSVSSAKSVTWKEGSSSVDKGSTESVQRTASDLSAIRSIQSGKAPPCSVVSAEEYEDDFEYSDDNTGRSESQKTSGACNSYIMENMKSPCSTDNLTKTDSHSSFGGSHSLGIVRSRIMVDDQESITDDIRKEIVNALTPSISCVTSSGSSNSGSLYSLNDQDSGDSCHKSCLVNRLNFQGDVFPGIQNASSRILNRISLQAKSRVMPVRLPPINGTKCNDAGWFVTETNMSTNKRGKAKLRLPRKSPRPDKQCNTVQRKTGPLTKILCRNKYLPTINKVTIVPYVEVKRGKNGIDMKEIPKHKPKPPYLLQSHALWNNGCLEVLVIGDESLLPPNSENTPLNVKVTVLPKPNFKNKQVKNPQSAMKQRNSSIDKNIISTRASWPPFNTYNDVEATRRRLIRFGL